MIIYPIYQINITDHHTHTHARKIVIFIVYVIKLQRHVPENECT